MIRRNVLSLRTLSLASVTWYFTVLAGWSLVATALTHVVTAPDVQLAPSFAMTAALIVLLELLPLVQGRGHDPQGVVMSTAFVFTMMFLWGPWPAIVLVAIGSLASDLRAGKPWWKLMFNPAQYGLSVGGSYLVVMAASHTTTLADPMGRFHISYLAWMCGAWVIYFCINLILVCGVLSYASSFWTNVTDDFWHNALMTFAVLALSPLVMVVGINYWPLMPLLLIPLLLLYYTAQLALEREYAAGHDALTGLSNRTTLQFELENAFATYQREGESFALMLIDLNDFKRVNDTLGHQVGDALLVHFAQRLQNSVRPNDHVARLGGDEFAVIVFDVDEESALHVAERVRESISDSIAIDTISLEMNLSLGIAMCPGHGVDGTTLLQRADVAMYLAKEKTTGVEIYSPERDENSADRLGLLGELRQALLDNALELHYQPKVSTRDSSPLGVEGLIRWRHPERGFVPPDEFIPLAERSGIMPLLTAHVVGQALAQAAEWRAAGMDVPVAVNISPTDLIGNQLTDLIETKLAECDLPPGTLLLEITERIGTNQLAEARETLTRLRELGVRISLDDFGTGYSSLMRLSSMPVDEIKIDRVFVTALSEGDRALGIVRAVVDLAHALHLPAIAEGVETAAEWQLLNSVGCDGIQGWHVARPMPADEATRWVRSRLGVAHLHTAPQPVRGTSAGGPTGVTVPAV